jgi:hypothetical protein
MICLCISSLLQDDFERTEGSLVRSAAEIGSVSILRTCISRGADPNLWEGIALYASCYNGNLEVSKYLLKEAHASTRFFAWKQKLFVVGLMSMEFLAITMFGMLVGVWAYGLGKALQERAIHAAGGWGGSGGGGGGGAGNGTYGTDGMLMVDPFGSGQDGVTIWELTAMTIPSGMAVIVMYRLVPFHRIVISFVLILLEDARRRKAERLARRQDAQNQLV